VPVVRIREFERFNKWLIASDQAVSYCPVYELTQPSGLISVMSGRFVCSALSISS
jgi:hypothetical protein